MAEETPTISALPDVQSTPSESKKAKLVHTEPPVPDGQGSATDAGPNGHGAGGELVEPAVDVVDEGGSGGQAGPSGPNGMGGLKVTDGIDGMDGATSPVVMAVSLPDEAEAQEEWWDLKMIWAGRAFEMRVGGNDMVYDFRARIEALTNVPPVRQKLIGLTKGKLSAELDSTRFGTLGVKLGCKFTMIGTPEELSFKDPSQVKLPDIYDDFDVEYPSHPGKAGKAVLSPAEDPRNKRKVEEVVRKCPITLMNDPRPGKKLLVLDLDYTIVDSKPLLAGSLPSEECARPGLHEFLERVYPHYDIVIWSQTHWRWLESKLVELGILGGTGSYRVCFVADRTSMFPVFTERNGQPFKHEVKPLAYFWSSFPQWSAKNTIHIDDLSRNFALNPGSGLKIRAYKTAGTHEGLQDQELSKLGDYLLNLATNVDDFTTLDHTRWKKGLRNLQPPLPLLPPPPPPPPAQ